MMARRKKGEPTRLQRLRASMRAFDGMPGEFRQFCAFYPRTTSGMTLAGMVGDAQGSVRGAIYTMRDLMPVEQEWDTPFAEPPSRRHGMGYTMAVPRLGKRRRRN
jgi:hypothetical protein